MTGLNGSTQQITGKFINSFILIHSADLQSGTVFTVKNTSTQAWSSPWPQNIQSKWGDVNMHDAIKRVQALETLNLAGNLPSFGTAAVGFRVSWLKFEDCIGLGRQWRDILCRDIKRQDRIQETKS